MPALRAAGYCTNAHAPASTTVRFDMPAGRRTDKPPCPLDPVGRRSDAASCRCAQSMVQPVNPAEGLTGDTLYGTGRARRATDYGARRLRQTVVLDYEQRQHWQRASPWGARAVNLRGSRARWGPAPPNTWIADQTCRASTRDPDARYAAEPAGSALSGSARRPRARTPWRAACVGGRVSAQNIGHVIPARRRLFRRRAQAREAIVLSREPRQLTARPPAGALGPLRRQPTLAPFAGGRSAFSGAPAEARP